MSVVTPGNRLQRTVRRAARRRTVAIDTKSENIVLPLVQSIAILATTLFAGAAIYINLVEHPARMGRSTELAAMEWAPSYKRASLMQAPLAIIGFLCGSAAWGLGADPAWLVAALFILAVVPFTLFVIEPSINKPLLAPGRNLDSGETRELLVKWGRFHAVRSVLGLFASVIFVWRSVVA